MRRGAAALLLLVGLGLGACTSGEQPSRSSSAPVVQTTGVRGEVDPSSGTIALPWDHYLLTSTEHDDIVSAQGVAMIECVEAAGLTSAEQPRRVIKDNDTSRLYGVWLMRYAERYGYVLPESKEKMAAIKGQSTGSVFSQAELDQRAKCATSALVTSLDTRTLDAGGPWVDEFSGVADAVRRTPAWHQATSAWAACLASAGFQADVDRLAAAGVDWNAVDKYQVEERDVKAAVADVACKEKTDLVQQLANLDASAQEPVVQKYQAELEKSHADLAAVHTHAIAILRDAGL